MKTRLLAKTIVLAASFCLALTACAPRLLPPGALAQSPLEPVLTETMLTTADGYELPYRAWLPDDGSTPKAIILAVHGFNDYSNAFAGPGAWLAKRGVAVYAYDQRGFGATANAGMWPGAQALIDDLNAMIAALRAAHDGLPLYMMGESMGGAVILAGWARAPLDIDGAVLVAPAIWGRSSMPAYMQTSLWLAAHTVPWMHLTGDGLDYLPSDNFEMLRDLGFDPLVIKATRVDAMWGLVNLMDEAQNAADDFNPHALILVGARDEIVPTHAAFDFLNRLAPAAKGQTVAIYEAGFHMLLRDLNGQTVWQDIASWIENADAPLPSQADRTQTQSLEDSDAREDRLLKR